MAQIYRLPAVSPTMETGTLVAWRLKVGEAFSAGAIIAEVGTDKATMEVEIFEDGVLLAQLVSEDAEIPVDAPIAVFGAKGEDATATIEQAKATLAAMQSGKAAPEPAAEPAPAPTPAPVEASIPARADPSEPRLFLDPPGDLAVGAPRGPKRASPAARKAATELGVDLRVVDGSGPHGRVLRSDVERQQTRAPTAASASRTIKLSPMRKTIAKRLTEVHQTVPTFTLNATFDVSGLVRWRERIKADFPTDHVSYNDLMCVAIARALRAFPEANASWTNEGIVQHGSVDLGVAVAVTDGLITPVVRGAENLSARAFAEQMRTLADKAHHGKLTPDEYQGNTFTVSNLGMFGITRFTAIINPPASAILALGAFEQRPIVADGKLDIGWRVDAVLTCDHRVIDGAVGAQFLRVLRQMVEEPGMMLT